MKQFLVPAIAAVVVLGLAIVVNKQMVKKGKKGLFA